MCDADEGDAVGVAVTVLPIVFHTVPIRDDSEFKYSRQEFEGESIDWDDDA